MPTLCHAAPVDARQVSWQLLSLSAWLNSPHRMGARTPCFTGALPLRAGLMALTRRDAGFSGPAAPYFTPHHSPFNGEIFAMQHAEHLSWRMFTPSRRCYQFPLPRHDYFAERL